LRGQGFAFASAGDVTLKGFGEPVALFELLVEASAAGLDD